MFDRFRRKPRHQLSTPGYKSRSVLGNDSTFNGTLQVEGELRIDGSFEGKLGISGQLVISEGALVDADIRAQWVEVAGTVNGSIAAEKVDILASGRVSADIATREFTSAEGCHFRGEVTLLH